MSDLSVSFRRNLKRFREQQNYSQEELSRKCGFDRTYIGKIERGERVPSLRTVETICNVLGCRYDECFYQNPGAKSDK